VSGFALEIGKVGAFLRRDVLTALTYKVGFVSDWVGLAISALLFYFVGKLIDPSVLPSYGGSRATYMEFVIVGMTLALFVQLSLARVSSVLRQEQFAGTLESLLMTPTAASTVQLGSVVYDSIYIPIRVAVFYAIVVLAFDLQLETSGIAPAGAYILAIIPFVWGLGLISAAITMTIRRGGGVVDLFVALLTLGAGAYFPLAVLPEVFQQLAAVNPLAIAIDGMRDALLGGEGWAGVPQDMVILIPIAAVSLLIGNIVFRYGVRHERKRGTLGLY
jgi:ABC-2 type transport system permease protein